MVSQTQETLVSRSQSIKQKALDAIPRFCSAPTAPETPLYGQESESRPLPPLPDEAQVTSSSASISGESHILKHPPARKSSISHAATFAPPLIPLSSFSHARSRSNSSGRGPPPSIFIPGRTKALPKAHSDEIEALQGQHDMPTKKSRIVDRSIRKSGSLPQILANPAKSSSFTPQYMVSSQDSLQTTTFGHKPSPSCPLPTHSFAISPLAHKSKSPSSLLTSASLSSTDRASSAFQSAPSSSVATPCSPPSASSPLRILPSAASTQSMHALYRNAGDHLSAPQSNHKISRSLNDLPSVHPVPLATQSQSFPWTATPWDELEGSVPAEALQEHIVKGMKRLRDIQKALVVENVEGLGIEVMKKEQELSEMKARYKGAQRRRDALLKIFASTSTDDGRFSFELTSAIDKVDALGAKVTELQDFIHQATTMDYQDMLTAACITLTRLNDSYLKSKTKARMLSKQLKKSDDGRSAQLKSDAPNSAQLTDALLQLSEDQNKMELLAEAAADDLPHELPYTLPSRNKDFSEEIAAMLVNANPISPPGSADSQIDSEVDYLQKSQRRRARGSTATHASPYRFPPRPPSRQTSAVPSIIVQQHVGPERGRSSSEPAVQYHPEDEDEDPFRSEYQERFKQRSLPSSEPRMGHRQGSGGSVGQTRLDELQLLDLLS